MATIENDNLCAKEVGSYLRRNKIKNVSYFLIKPKTSRESNNSTHPGFYRTVNENISDLDFKYYCTKIREYPDESFDLIAVDGRARYSYILEAIPKLKQGGYLLLDNTERDRYIPGAELLLDWERRDFFGPVTHQEIFQQTSIFKRPGFDE